MQGMAEWLEPKIWGARLAFKPGNQNKSGAEFRQSRTRNQRFDGLKLVWKKVKGVQRSDDEEYHLSESILSNRISKTRNGVQTNKSSNPHHRFHILMGKFRPI